MEIKVKLKQKNYTFVFNENMIISCVNEVCNMKQLNHTELTYEGLEEKYNILLNNTICYDDNYMRFPFCVVCMILICLMFSR